MMSSLSATTRSSTVAFMTNLPTKLRSAPQDGADPHRVDICIESGGCNAVVALRTSQPPELAIDCRWAQFAKRRPVDRFTGRSVTFSRRRRAGKQALLYDGVDAPVTVDHLRHAEIHTDGNQ